MGMSVGGGSGGLNSEPNVVPMIDIMLVLLIIFMIMQPMMRKAIDMQLPDPQPAVVTANTASDQIVLEVLPGGNFAVNREPLTKDNLAQRIKEIYENRPDKIMFVKGDPAVQYQDVIFAMDVSRGSGVKVIGVTPKTPD
ncbi:MAG: biopolymer transporter ExbD [Gemmatimonadetes bacterium]|nr:biopolymer transporter ExbD [Gemmatimonadota bacterium]